MLTVREEIIAALKTASNAAIGQDLPVRLEHPVSEAHGDYASNIALIGAKIVKKPPMVLAGEIAGRLKETLSKDIKVDIAAPGFINFSLPQAELVKKAEEAFRFISKHQDRKIMVEYAHPNTHKEMHIGHMRTLITGEAISRLLEVTGGKVFRANYQGDIGPHVAKAIFGIKRIMQEKGINLSDVEGWSSTEKAHFLGEGYVRGNQEYDEHKEEIDRLNSNLYLRKPEVMGIYNTTRQWSLDYYAEFYERFYTAFDRLFFESEMVEKGKEIVRENIGKVFTEDNGAIIFPGEQYALHTRVFITQAGNPTYEGKEMANAFAEHEAFPFDLKIHIVANEQAGYFKVVFKALDLIDPEKFEGKQHHVSMGMVQLTDRKMSSRTGVVLTVDWLISQVKERIEKLVAEGKIDAGDRERVVEQVAIGAIKYSVLKVSTGQNVAFDIEKSVSLDGDSGPYLQYTYARTQSVLAKSKIIEEVVDDYKFETEELSVLRSLYRFEEVVGEAADTLSPHLLATYLFDLAQKFNLFYQKHKILGSDKEAFRLGLTGSVGRTLKKGLELLGIQAPEKM